MIETRKQKTVRDIRPKEDAQYVPCKACSQNMGGIFHR